MRLKGHVQKIVKLFCEEKWPSMLLHLQIFYSRLSSCCGFSSDSFDMTWYWFYLTKANSQRVKSHIMCAYSLMFVTLNAIIIPHFCAYFRNNGDQHLVKLWIPPLSFCLTFLRQHPKIYTRQLHWSFIETHIYYVGILYMSLWLKDKANLERYKE